MDGIHIIAEIKPTIDNLCVRIRVIRLWTLPSYGNSSLPYSIEMVWLDEDGGKIHASVKMVLVSRFVTRRQNKFWERADVDYTGGLLPTSKAFSIIEGEKVEGVKYFVPNLLLEFSNEVVDNDESEVLENAITPTKLSLYNNREMERSEEVEFKQNGW
ncbi:hypothetical protein Ahy_B03g066929 [Arachis hypogaea]|uniref:Replication protein A 70 kDa DNA-binding subunit B/D first OB fold domain-containing protein n=1 Tax=Arachis hypogaea TaxID=3818 RepID=A0A445A5K4_ARAHY|nr:hypothetical protein Ahy_B03g066929 [Arachis hypogaea]